MPGRAHVLHAAHLLLQQWQHETRPLRTHQATAGGLQGRLPRLRSAATKECCTLVAGLLAAILSNKAAVACSADTHISSVPPTQQGGHQGCPCCLLLGWFYE
jgi:hypothetical protein